MPEQQLNTVTQPVPEAIPKAPVFVRVIAWFMLIGGIFYLLISTPFVFFGGSGAAQGIEGGLKVFLNGAMVLAIGIGLIVTAFGLRKLKRWALYTYTAVVVIGLVEIGIGYLSNKSGSDDLFTVIIQILILIYFWTIQDKFNR